VWGAKPYSESHTRSVSIAEQLAKKHQVIYIEPQMRNGYKPGYASLPVKPALTVVQLKQIKKSVVQSLTLLLKSYKKNHLRFLVMNPEWLPYIKHLKQPLYVDRAHELVKIPHDKRYVTVAPHKKLGRFVIPNGCDMDLLKDASNTVETCDVGLCWIKRPVIGYIGDMDERIDEELIGKVAAAFPHATIVLVGNTNYRPVIAVSEKHDNIFPVGQQPSHKLSLYLQSFDMLILPTRPTLSHSLTHESLPLFLASGKPIVCMGTNSVGKGLRNSVYLAKNHTSFVFQVEKALKESKKSKKRLQRVKMAQKLQWNVASLLRRNISLFK
jgi:glycosyltransferase involved in cell wall biosynthesis